MRILIDQSGHALRNVGDWAMLKVAIDRCTRLFPGCVISLIGDRDRIRQLFPDVQAIEVCGRDGLLDEGCVFGRYSGLLRGVDRILATRLPRPTHSLALRFGKVTGRSDTSRAEFSEALHYADLVLVSGGGFISDQFPRMVTGVSNLLVAANALKKPAVMLGQGLGPLTNPWLRTRAGEAFRTVELLSLREEAMSRKVASDLGVKPERVAVTGDDAIELAYEARPVRLGSQVGFNMRVAPYSGVSAARASEVRAVICAVADDVSAGVIPVAISHFEHESDHRHAGGDSAEGIATNINERFAPYDLLSQIGTCRTVVTGSYHAGVFALSQGVSVVGLYAHPYYEAKFKGLRAQFGEGCRCVDLRCDGDLSDLTRSFSESFESADCVRTLLLERAQHQIGQGTAVYESLKRFAA